MNFRVNKSCILYMANFFKDENTSFFNFIFYDEQDKEISPEIQLPGKNKLPFQLELTLHVISLCFFFISATIN